MATVHFVKKARKADKENDIKKGDSYYWWKFRFGGKHKSKTHPRPSQLTGSEFMSTVLSITETLEDLKVHDDLEASVETAKGELENLRDETQEKFDNMPEGLQQGDTGQLLEGRVSSVEEMISELENIDAAGMNEVPEGTPGQDDEDDDADAEGEDDDEDEGEEKEEKEDDDEEKPGQEELDKREEVLQEIQAVEYTGE